MSSLLFRASLRHLFRHRWQMVLSVVGIGLGVAVVVAIDLAIESAHRAFRVSVETVEGRATHQVVAGSAGLADSLYRVLRVEAGVRPAAPVVEGWVTVPRRAGAAFRLVGVDPFSEPPFRPYVAPGRDDLDLGAFLTEPGAVLLARGAAEELGLARGDTFGIRAGPSRRTARLAGVVEPTGELARRGLGRVLLADVATAQELLGRPGRLTRIDVILPAGAPGEAEAERIRRALPAGAELVPAGSRTRSMEEMTRAFTLNLTALSLLALLFGAFLVYNSMTFSVVRRRRLLGTLRALGVSRREIFGVVLGEALALGLAATAAGIAGGVVLGGGLVHLVTRTVNDLYFVVSVRELAVPAAALAKGGVLGVGATLVAAVPPLREATGAAPRRALVRSTVEARARTLARPAAAAGVGLGAAGTGLLAVPGGGVVAGFVSLFLILLGFALLTPAVTVALAAAARPLLDAVLGIVGRMAARGVPAALSRTGPAVGALAVAVSVTVGLGVMIDSFRGTVEAWLGWTLRADVYVAAPGLLSNRPGGALPRGLTARIREAEGVAAVSTYRGVEVRDGAAGVRVVAMDLAPESRERYRFRDAVPDLWERVGSGAVLISEPYAHRRGLGAGDTIRLLSPRGRRPFAVAGVFRDYGSERGVVMMDREDYDRWWDDPSVSSAGIFVVPGAAADAVRRRIEAAVPEGETVVVRSSGALREASLRVFDRTFLITGVLRLLAFVVAFVGVLSALMALQLERGRELAVLRATGLTPGQVWPLVTSQTGLMGAVAGIVAIPAGLALAAVMIFVVNRRSFGWTLGMEVGGDVLVEALLLAIVAALLAGLYPAHRMARTSPALALREE